jgi:hypothetical protein
MSNTLAEVKSGYWTEVREGFQTTKLLLTLRWRMIRNPKAKIGITLGLLFLLFGITISINLGYAVQIASQQANTVSSIYAHIWIQSLQFGTMASIGAFAVGGAVVVALFAPFTGSSTLALFPTEDMEAIRLPRAHRYFDSFIINIISGIGLLQLITLTGVTSLITLDGERLPALIFTWSIWALLIAVTTTVGWTLEWVLRKWGKAKRRVIGLIGFSILSLVVASDPHHGSTLFGASAKYTKTLRSSLHGWNLHIVLIILIAIVAFFSTVFVGVASTRKALALPAPASATYKERKNHTLGNSVLTVSTRLLLRILWRTAECRRPIFAILLIGMPTLALVHLDSVVQNTIGISIPLAIALAWGVNIFGVLGTGMPWLSSQPKIMKYLPRIAALLQFLLTFILLTALWAVSLISKNTTVSNAPIVLLMGAASAALVTAVSLDLSIRRPIRTRLSGRGDALVPPITALAYMIRLVALALIPTVVTAAGLNKTKETIAFIAMFLFSIIILAIQEYRWNNPEVRANVVIKVSAA